MPRKPRSDFNTSVHAIFEHLGAGDLPPDVEIKDAEQRVQKEVEAAAEREAAKDPAAVALGRKGGLKGGKARQAQLSEEERRQRGGVRKRSRPACWATATV